MLNDANSRLMASSYTTTTTTRTRRTSELPRTSYLPSIPQNMIPEDIAIGSGSYVETSPVIKSLVVVGGGASGAGIVLNMLDKARKSQKHMVDSITIVEKNPILGVGLAYSDACTGALVNAQVDTMGIYADNKAHFYQWLCKRHGSYSRDGFPSRTEYGLYLVDCMKGAVQEAKGLGIEFRSIKGEVMDIKRIQEQAYKVEVSTGETLNADNVVLALGNFNGALHKEFEGMPGYFSSVWPNEKLKSIPSEEHVVIYGSRLTAIDAAIFLSRQGHSGPITFVSRGGKLPKVQGAAVPFERKWALEVLARDLEKSPEGALKKLMGTFLSEVQRSADMEWSDFTKDVDTVEDFRQNIKEAKLGPLAWEGAFRGTNDIVEKYWRALNEVDRMVFLKKYQSTWLTWRHSIPIENGERILALMDKGQLKVVKGGRARWAGSEFVIPTGTTEITTKYIVEAVGPEHDVHKIKSPLMQNILASKLVEAHPHGGIQCDFTTNLVTKGMWVVGSMTRGIHFFTASVNRNVAHSQRIIGDILGETPRRQMHVALFATDTATSKKEVMELATKLLGQRHTPFVFMSSRDADLQTLAATKGFLIDTSSDYEDVRFTETLARYHIEAAVAHDTKVQSQAHVCNYFRKCGMLLNMPAGLPTTTVLESLDILAHMKPLSVDPVEKGAMASYRRGSLLDLDPSTIRDMLKRTIEANQAAIRRKAQMVVVDPHAQSAVDTSDDIEVGMEPWHIGTRRASRRTIV